MTPRPPALREAGHRQLIHHEPITRDASRRLEASRQPAEVARIVLPEVLPGVYALLRRTLEGDTLYFNRSTELDNLVNAVLDSREVGPGLRCVRLDMPPFRDASDDAILAALGVAVMVVGWHPQILTLSGSYVRIALVGTLSGMDRYQAPALELLAWESGGRHSGTCHIRHVY